MPVFFERKNVLRSSQVSCVSFYHFLILINKIERRGNADLNLYSQSSYFYHVKKFITLF